MYATERKEWRWYPRKFTDKMREQVVQILREKQWSPEQIVGRFWLKGIPIVGTPPLYTFLHEDKALGGGDPLPTNKASLEVSTKEPC
ncbi:hypothetical protein SAMN02745171_01594 [Porphyromonas circumdentaria]|uniref:Uncharacterized protein n=2 Tax=Porphyromonas circumdentaria TaxID=29524 RepID=A0A1T4PV17_9PORP|nr:hypothetical protein SAMN02745171_01594 [Porphyromonas circumdentaria]